MIERQPPASPPTAASDDPEIEPLRFEVRENAQGEQRLWLRQPIICWVTVRESELFGD